MRFVYDARIEKIVPKDGGYEVRWVPVASDVPVAPDDTEAATAPWRPIQVDGVVICAGTSSRRFGAMLGDRLNIYPVKGYSITVNLHTPEAQAAAPTVSILDDAAKDILPQGYSVDYAGEWAARPLRFYLEGNSHVSRK